MAAWRERWALETTISMSQPVWQIKQFYFVQIRSELRIILVT